MRQNAIAQRCWFNVTRPDSDGSEAGSFQTEHLERSEVSGILNQYCVAPLNIQATYQVDCLLRALELPGSVRR